MARVAEHDAYEVQGTDRPEPVGTLLLVLLALLRYWVGD